MSPFVWMFISSHEHLRRRLVEKETISSLIQLEYSGFKGATVPICAFTLQQGHAPRNKGCFIRLSEFRGSRNQAPKTLEAILSRDCGWFYEARQSDFTHIPGSPIAYWLSERIRDVFRRGTPLGELVEAREGLKTGNNDQFLRRWWEVPQQKVGYGMASRDEAARSGKKWFPYNKGGEFRKWYGNHEYLINWENDGREIRAFRTEHSGRPRSGIQNAGLYFREALTWSDVTSGPTSFRLVDRGSIHGNKGHCAFAGVFRLLLAAYCNTPIVRAIVTATNPTLSFGIGYFKRIPFLEDDGEDIRPTAIQNVAELTRIVRGDWNAYERFHKNLPPPPPPHICFTYTFTRRSLHGLGPAQSGYYRRSPAQGRREQPPLYPCLRSVWRTLPNRTPRTGHADRQPPPTGTKESYPKPKVGRACVRTRWRS